MRTLEEEVINAYSHLISAILSLLFCTIFIARVSDDVHKIQLLILGLTSTWTFFSSFLYHITMKPKKRSRNLVLDRVGIYLMITATGISFSLGSPDDIKKLIFCSIILSANCFLVTKYCFKREESELYSIISCLLFSVLCIVPILGVFNENSIADQESVWLLSLGLVSYAAGVIFYTNDSKKWAHTIWHILVAIGYSSCFLTHLMVFGAI